MFLHKLAKSEDKAQILGISREFISIFYPMNYRGQLPFRGSDAHFFQNLVRSQKLVRNFFEDILDLESHGCSNFRHYSIIVLLVIAL